MVRGTEAIARHYLAILDEAQREIRGCTKYHARIAAPATSGGESASYLSALCRGIPHRWIWDRRILEVPSMTDTAEKCMALGEELRSIQELPAGMTVVDDSVALLHLYPDDPSSDDVTTVVTRHPGLVAVIEKLFESLWSRAVPVLAQSGITDDSDLDAIVALLSSGTKDEAIARHLNISVRTLARRIQQLMSDLGVQTRFQAGVKLGELQRLRGLEPDAE